MIGTILLMIQTGLMELQIVNKNAWFKAILAYFKLSDISHNEIYKLITSENGDNLLGYPK